MLLEEDVVMNQEEIRVPPRPVREASPELPRRDDDQQQAADETPAFSYAPTPPPMPWPRVFPSL
ncbi:hypothetical protein SAMN02745126_03732 [Enhydrobacter aerosaccus]|uniref:Uncharacterized protein n=1 Tax=Enhydrobacter aerosaccus TaxID=225324 RepID=A0A1T4RAD3_9HYPH|nr:hypothetical protein [Enhydrobacter aerosaccus]SKA13020.1 hypothetical protein SAMN02745126_03732 [Enhydrobacter aerosaccus]